MKTKMTVRVWLQWVITPLLAGCLLAWNLVPAYPEGVVPKATALAKTPTQAGASAKANTFADTQEIRDRLKELEVKERQNYTLVLEGQRKTMDWWFSFLAVLTAILAIFGALIPFLMARKDKILIEQDKEQIKHMLTEAEATVAKIHQKHEEAERTLKTFDSSKITDAETKKIKEAVAVVQQDPKSDPALGLRAEAIAASQAEQADKAYALWRALIELAPADAIAQFNAGYWAQMLGQRSHGDEAVRWFRQSGQHDKQAFNLKPDMHEAVNNWGNALAAEAQALAASDLAAACTLWQQAHEKYQQALDVKPDKHEAVMNWGVSLAAEAQALTASDLVAARTLWRQAGEKYQQALNLKPDMHEAVNNWGLALAAEAQALTASDLAVARTLWRQAGEKYQQALSLKPDMHEAAQSWGGALLYEANVLTSADGEEARLVLDRAEQILQAHAVAAPGIVAYNLACVYGRRGDVTNCLHWLKVSQAHNTLPDCAKLRTDPDLDAVRTSPEFTVWLQSVCP